MRHILVFVLVLIIHQPLFSQNATIKVIDAQSKEDLPFVNMGFKSLSTDNTAYTTSNLKGEALNLCQDKSIITLSFIGYKTLIDTIEPLQAVTYRLQPDVFNLNQITVTGTRTEKHLKDAPVITQVITNQDIDNRGLNNVQEVLTDDMPSVDFQQSGFGTNIQMQGLGAKYVLFLIDGERIAGETGSNIDYNRLNTANIERIEVVKGAASALYGSQAMGGVINIITKDTRKKVEIDVGSKFKQYNQYNFRNLKTTDARLYYKQNLDRPNMNNNASVGLNFNKLSSRTDFVIKSFDAYKIYDKQALVKQYTNIDTTIYTPIDSLGIDGYEDYSIHQKFKYKFSDKLTASIKGSYYDHNQYSFASKSSYKKYTDISYGGDVNYKFSDESSITASFFADTYNKYIIDTDTKVVLTNDYTHSYKTPKLLFNTRLLKKNLITAGAEFIDESLNSNKFVLNSDKIENRSQQTTVFFLQNDYDFNDRINFVAGARVDISSAFGVHLAPKISAMYKADKLTYRLNCANGFRTPSLKELYMHWDHLGMFDIVGNANLKPESNNYFSFAGELTTNLIKTSATVYHNRFKNKIELIAKNNELYEYSNFDYSNLTGLDVDAKVRIIKGLSFSGAYSYIFENYSSNTIRVSAVSPHSFNMRLEYHLRKGMYNAIFNLSGKFYSAKHFTATDEITYRGKDVLAEYNMDYEAYTMWKFSISQKIFNSVNLVLSIDNIFDYQARYADYNSNLTPGRRFAIGLNISVNKFYEYFKTN